MQFSDVIVVVFCAIVGCLAVLVTKLAIQVNKIEQDRIWYLNQYRACKYVVEDIEHYVLTTMPIEGHGKAILSIIYPKAEYAGRDE